MPEIGTEIGNIFDKAARTRVYVADALREADFEEVDYLYCSELVLTVAPMIDAASLEYEYGRFIREGESEPDDYPPLEMIGKFVKVTVEDTDEEDRGITWYGVVEEEDQTVYGSADAATGLQKFRAVGLLRLIDKEPIRTSQVSNYNEDDVIEIKRGLPFNLDPGGYFTRRGNRSTTEIDDVYAFSNEVRTLNTWNAYEAVRYLLEYHAPKDDSGTITNVWKFDPENEDIEDLIGWYDISVQTDGRSVKSVIDELIDRRRAVGYFVEFDPSDDSVIVKVFTNVDTDITLPSGVTLGANPDQYSLNFEAAIDIEEAVVNNLETTRYHTVIARGARRTSTFTDRIPVSALSTRALMPDWDTDEKQEYLEAASGVTGYDDIDDYEKGRLNASFRSDDRLRHVFTRFRINPQWRMRLNDEFAGGDDKYLLAPVISDSGTPIDPEYEEGVNENEPIWLNGVRLLRSLPFLDRYDYTGDAIAEKTFSAGFTDLVQPEYIPPFAFIETVQGNETETVWIWEYLDKLGLAGDDAKRQWSAGLSIIDTAPAIQFNVNPNQLLAKTVWNEQSPAYTLPEHDPKEVNGIDYTDISVTLCMELDQHIEAIETISTPAADSPAGRLIIAVPDARFDYVVPYTITAITRGVPAYTETGGAVRDDRERLEDIARAAAEWYGRPRQTLRLTYRQIRPLFKLGWLITSTGENTTLENVNTVVTSIRYEFGSVQAPGAEAMQKTRIETSFAELDVR